MTTSYEKGYIGEIAALLLLFFKGYEILEWRSKSKFGEIDIITKKGKEIVFIEVKLRKTLEAAQFAPSPKQIKRITHSAQIWCNKREWTQKYNYRFDVIAIAPFKIKHIKDAFRPNNEVYFRGFV